MKNLLLPPALILIMLLVSKISMRRRHDRGWWLGVVALVVFYALSTPTVSYLLISSLEIYPPLTGQMLHGDDRGQVVVILSAEGRYETEFSTFVPGPLTQTRMVYGVFLARRLGLPILVTGGAEATTFPSLARQMRDSLIRDYQFRNPVWMEERSVNTWENALFSAALLRARGVRRIYLVTHSWHERRAVRCFEEAGISVIPAPTDRHSMKWTSRDLLPSLGAFIDSYYALYEMLGYHVYSLRHFHRKP